MQAIGLLSHLRAKGLLGPFLVVGPLSTLPHWVAEFERWCPSLPALLYHGSRLERQQLRTTRMPTGSQQKSVHGGWVHVHPGPHQTSKKDLSWLCHGGLHPVSPAQGQGCST